MDRSREDNAQHGQTGRVRRDHIADDSWKIGHLPTTVLYISNAQTDEIECEMK